MLAMIERAAQRVTAGGEPYHIDHRSHIGATTARNPAMRLMQALKRLLHACGGGIASLGAGETLPPLSLQLAHDAGFERIRFALVGSINAPHSPTCIAVVP
jgi:hypothetical protein